MIRAPGQIARAYLAQLLEQEGDVVLPSLDAMARSAGVSRMTMWQALREYCRAGTLRALRGRGYFVAARARVASPSSLQSLSVSAPLSSAPPWEPRWREIHRRLMNEIRDGTLVPGKPLPPLKLLRARYHTGYGSLTCALRRLTADGVLERVGKGWRVYAVSPRAHRATVAVIAFVPHVRTLATVTPRAPRLWAALEDECRRLNLRLDVLGLEQVLGRSIETNPRPELLAAYHRHHQVLGYLVFLLGIWSTAYEHLYRALLPLECPVAFLVETDEPYGIVFRGPDRFAFFQIALTQRCGEEVGRYLFRLGHRRIAFFTTTAADQILHRRYEGLKSFFTTCGCSDAVLLFQYAGSRSYADLNREQAESAVARTVAGFQRRLTRVLTAELGMIPPTINGQVSEMTRTLDGIARTSFAYQKASAAFAAAAADPEITAWVGADDPTALVALDWCRHHGLRVPGDVSIVGFDDSEEALGAGLTSYNFNQESTLRAMITHIVDGRKTSSRERASQEAVELPGFISDRLSSGPARKRTQA